MAIKVQLDGQALAALIGGDSEIEVELRRSVVEEFTRHYLKGVASEPNFKNAINNEINQVKSQIQDMVRAELVQLGCKLVKIANSAYKVELPSVVVQEIQATVRSQVTQAISVAISTAVNEAVDAFDAGDKVGMITDVVTDQLQEKVKRAVVARINAMKVEINEPDQG